ncbi:hypothetical protein BK127_31595 [Paenibacillus sp. FSL H7-0331]|nr:hypothetical protein BK127_31595 [Paenibacillus sp. FSL H7-0331]
MIHKKITKPILGFISLLTAEQTLKGIEAMHMIRKGQAENNSSVLSAVAPFAIRRTGVFFLIFSSIVSHRSY